MPSFEAHRKAGFIFSIIFIILFAILLYTKYPFLNWKLIYAPAVIWFFSNISDIDHHAGKLRKYSFRAIFFLLAVSSILFAFYGYSTIIILFTILGVIGLSVLRLIHRGITHTYLFILVASLPVLFIHWYLFLLAFVAGSSHIFVDRLWSKSKRKAAKFFGWRTSQHTTINILSRR